MNVYYVTKCSKCGEPIVMDPVDKVMVHGYKNVEKAIELIKAGMSITELRKGFCGYCGNCIPKGEICGCENPSPQ